MCYLFIAAQCVFQSVQMASAVHIAEFFKPIGNDIHCRGEIVGNLLIAVANSDTVPSTCGGPTLWNVYHLNTILEFGPDPNSRTAGGQNLFHCIINVRLSI